MLQYRGAGVRKEGAFAQRERRAAESEAAAGRRGGFRAGPVEHQRRDGVCIFYICVYFVFCICICVRSCMNCTLMILPPYFVVLLCSIFLGCASLSNFIQIWLFINLSFNSLISIFLPILTPRPCPPVGPPTSAPAGCVLPLPPLGRLHLQEVGACVCCAQKSLLFVLCFGPFSVASCNNRSGPVVLYLIVSSFLYPLNECS